MTKEEYIKIRGDSEFPLFIAYEYWKEKKPVSYKDIILEDFEKQFTLLIANYSHVPIQTPNGIKIVSYEKVVEKVFEHFNLKFNL